MPHKDSDKRRETNSKCCRAWYLRNKAMTVARSKARKKALLEELRVIKEKAGCRNCGFRVPVALDFHHLDPKLKSFSPSEGARLFGRKRVLEEVAKCEVLCANCHRILHS